jgi:hypothetical protein
MTSREGCFACCGNTPPPLSPPRHRESKTLVQPMMQRMKRAASQRAQQQAKAAAALQLIMPLSPVKLMRSAQGSDWDAILAGEDGGSPSPP